LPTPVLGYKNRLKTVRIVLNLWEENRHLIGYDGVAFLFTAGDKMASGTKLYMNQVTAIIPVTPQCVGSAE
jgi:hypothetical protein